MTQTILKMFVAFVVLWSFVITARSATLQAKVIDVESGNTLQVSNINRTLRVRLKGIAPPEAGQAFNVAAREHLKALVLGKAVTLDYTHLADGYLEARVILNGIDIGAQMLRDGVAWYNHALDYELSETDRDLYAQCENAARAEKRGLWHEQSPVPPWEYRRLQTAQLERISSASSLQPTRPPTKASLSSEDVFGGRMGPMPATGAFDIRPISERGTPDRWTKYESVGGHYSVTVPSNSVAGTNTFIDAKTGKSVPFDFVAGGSELGFYCAMSAIGPNNNYTDASARDEAIESIIKGMNQAARSSRTGPAITIKAEREVRVGSNVGMQYHLSGDGFSGTARVFTTQVGSEREIFLLFTLNRPGAEALGNQFIDSFSIVR